MKKASREVANLTERKIQVPTYVVSKNMSVCKALFDPDYHSTGKKERDAKKFGPKQQHCDPPY